MPDEDTKLPADVKRVLSLGAGLQSSVLLLMSCKGELPRLDHAVFADTQYEPEAVYAHFEWLKEETARYGIPISVVTAGNIREDSLEFRQDRKSSDGKRRASIPFFVKNPDGKQGKVSRQCTKEYKIIPVETFIRREVMGLKKRQRAPKAVAVEQWMGITADESQRAKPPGVYKTRKRTIKSPTLFDGQATRVIELKEWKPTPWKTHTFPFLNLTLMPNRSHVRVPFVPEAGGWDRAACVRWVGRAYPDRAFPRSACVCCPFRTNEEWRRMRDESPRDWADAVQYDVELRQRSAAGVALRTATGKQRKPMVGEVFVHRQMIPLGLVDLRVRGYADNECGTGGQPACEGMCGV